MKITNRNKAGFFKNLILLSLLSFSSFAQEIGSEFSDIDAQKDWQFTLSPYAMLAAQATDVGGEKIRQSFSDLASMTNAGFQIAAEVRYKRALLSFDGTFATLGHTSSKQPLYIDLSIIQRILDFQAGYIVYDNFEYEAGETVLHGWILKFDVGAKYWSNEIDVVYGIYVNDIPILEGGINEPQEWWDLMLGMDLTFALNRKAQLGVGLDVGGFGIGNASKFTYNFTYINSFKVLRWMNVNAGFRNFMYRRIDGVGENALETKVNVLGPLLGVSFSI